MHYGRRIRGVTLIKRLACSLFLVVSMPVIGVAAERVSLDSVEQPPNPPLHTQAYAEKTDHSAYAICTMVGVLEGLL